MLQNVKPSTDFLAEMAKFDAHVERYCSSGNKEKAMADALVECIYKAYDIEKPIIDKCNKKLFPTFEDEKSYYCMVKGLEEHRSALTTCYVQEKVKEDPDWDVASAYQPSFITFKARKVNECTGNVLSQL
ncbi:hypothetical protein HDE_12146 [Halotydeus destructor]|nr:hypothetical protein HDE_12146 [Halotydeus destructor]